MKQSKVIEVDFLTSPLKWAGGKRWLVPTLAKLYREHGGKRRLVEPFCGACSVAFGLRPKYALLNDLNMELIAFMEVLQVGGKLEDVGGNNKRDFLGARTEFNILTAVPGGTFASRHRIASLLYYLNRTCFNGLYRVNSDGQFNVPFGKYKSIGYSQEFPAHALAMKHWRFMSARYDLVHTRKTDFVYIDPPYDDGFVQFTAQGFGWEEQVKLAEWAARRQGVTVVSNAATSRILKLYRQHGFSVKTIDGPRRISSDGDRKPAREMLAIKY